MPSSRQLIQFYQATRFTIPNNSNVNPEDVELLNNPKYLSLMKKPLWQTNEISARRLEEGSFCQRRFDGKSGYCLLAYQCLHAIKEFRVHGITIDVCTYRRKIPVICCPLDTKDIELTGKRLSLRSKQIIPIKCYLIFPFSECEEYNENFKSVKDKNPTEFSGKKCVASIPLIVGGELTNSGEYPHMVSLFLSTLII